MIAPFDQKSRLGAALDRLGIRLLILLLCCLWFYRLWNQWPPALAAGLALAALCWQALALGSKRALARRESALRRRIGGALALDALLLCPPRQSALRVAQWLASLYPLENLRPGVGGALAEYRGETLLLRCLQIHPSQSAAAGDVLAAQRALRASAAARCVLCAPGSFDLHAQRAAEALDPPVRLIDGDALRGLAGRLYPATDAQLTELGARQRKPFAWVSLRRHVFAPQKTRRYAAYATGLMVFYIVTGQAYALACALCCFLLAMGSHRRRHAPLQL
ncbi:MAG: hypothetical protein LBU67_07005 [Oscillospiraceae bacterium]|jgi:hypothetical protein|nr:hypothetical protein [Oscillospiraceae bacterium]